LLYTAGGGFGGANKIIKQKLKEFILFGNQIVPSYMKSYRFLFVILFIWACNSSTQVPAKKNKHASKKDAGNFVFRERLVQGSDTAILDVHDLGVTDLDMVLSQRWQLSDVSDASDDRLVWVNGNEKRLFPELILFSDFNAVVDPRIEMKTGKWKRKLHDKTHTIYFTYGNGKTKTYRIRELSATNLKLSWKDGADSFWINFHSDGKIHQNVINDPFYPANNTWRIKPRKKETDAQVFERVKGCVRFYALYYRDAIKRQKKEITWLGLPEIFEWYNQAIGLPEKKLVEDSWIKCFYNKEQALQGYDILHKLIVDYEYDWPANTPGWEFQTQSVLEQMYFKMDSVRI
jgi:hypothetical protein